MTRKFNPGDWVRFNARALKDGRHQRRMRVRFYHREISEVVVVWVYPKKKRNPGSADAYNQSYSVRFLELDPDQDSTPSPPPCVMLVVR